MIAFTIDDQVMLPRQDFSEEFLEKKNNDTPELAFDIRAICEASLPTLIPSSLRGAILPPAFFWLTHTLFPPSHPHPPGSLEPEHAPRVDRMRRDTIEDEGDRQSPGRTRLS
jgi:hypothetical protein